MGEGRGWVGWGLLLGLMDIGRVGGELELGGVMGGEGLAEGVGDGVGGEVEEERGGILGGPCGDEGMVVGLPLEQPDVGVGVWETCGAAVDVSELVEEGSVGGPGGFFRKIIAEESGAGVFGGGGSGFAVDEDFVDTEGEGEHHHAWEAGGLNVFRGAEGAGGIVAGFCEPDGEFGSVLVAPAGEGFESGL
ncbi:MAG: hypothetical protein RI897_3926 [Verrucomicrobiota bacterium]